jgi:hypothetical protein
MRTGTSPIARIAAIVASATLLVTIAGCGGQDVAFNPDFSVNLFQPGPKWPNVEKLTPAQKEVYQRYGKPEQFRVLWNPTGQVKTRSELAQTFQNKKMPKELPPHTYLYMNLGKEMWFEGGSFVERPITDMTRILVKLGDPEDIKPLPNGGTQWMFYGAGRLYKFDRDGATVEEKEFPAMGRYIKS